MRRLARATWGLADGERVSYATLRAEQRAHRWPAPRTALLRQDLRARGHVAPTQRAAPPPAGVTRPALARTSTPFGVRAAGNVAMTHRPPGGDPGRRKRALAAGAEKPQYAAIRERPRVTTGRMEKLRTGCGSACVHVNDGPDGLLEVLLNPGKSGGCPARSEATARSFRRTARTGVFGRFYDPPSCPRAVEQTRDLPEKT